MADDIDAWFDLRARAERVLAAIEPAAWLDAPEYPGVVRGLLAECDRLAAENKVLSDNLYERDCRIAEAMELARRTYEVFGDWEDDDA